MFQFTDSRFTHMPFAAVRPDGGAEEFCCIPVDGLWKLYHFTGKKWKRIRTGLPEDATECAPCADFEDGIWKISFIAGGWKGDRRFRLYTWGDFRFFVILISRLVNRDNEHPPFYALFRGVLIPLPIRFFIMGKSKSPSKIPLL